mmetsp:Transcript_27369/g.44068  ORF Transcript_27369/g.44068 Transcript_27369/m.44068 type:complete len:247 (-) Transcript_27369:2308-3048(-)
MHLNGDILRHEFVNQSGGRSWQVADQLLLASRDHHQRHSRATLVVEVHALHGALIHKLQQARVGHTATHAQGGAWLLLLLHLLWGTTHGLQRWHIISLRWKRTRHGGQRNQGLRSCRQNHLLWQGAAVRGISCHILHPPQDFLAGAGRLALRCLVGEPQSRHGASGDATAATADVAGAAEATARAIRTGKHHGLVGMQALGLGIESAIRGGLDLLARVRSHRHLGIAHDQLAFSSCPIDQLDQLFT